MVLYGAAYYPEQETAAQVEADAARMRAIGFTLMRIGEFAWSRLEPEPGRLDFAWLDHAIATLAGAGVRTLLCTPSACPPRWLTDAHPEILYRDQRGVVRPHGGRRHYCPTHLRYRQHCVRIAEALASRYGAHPAVVGFQVDNELGQETTGRCACPACRLRFREDLARRYGTIEAFNARAGMAFWSQTYTSFDQIEPPLRSIEPGGEQVLASFYDHPTLRLEWERSCSDAITAFLGLQVTALRTHTRLPISTNSCGWWTNANDLYRAAALLDVAGGDIYPSLRGQDMIGAGCDFAFHRGLKGADFWLLETNSGGGHGVWAQQGVLQPFPGTMTQNMLLAAAHGAAAICHFQYATFRAGQEQLEAAVIDLDGRPRRREREYRAAAAQLQALAPLLAESRVAHDIAIVYHYDSHWATRIKPFHRAYHHPAHASEIAAALTQQGLTWDIRDLGAALAQYRVVVLPAPVVLSDPERSALARFVQDGGTLLTTFLAGIKGEDNTAARAAIPDQLTGVFGMRVGEGEPVLREPTLDTAAQIALRLGETTLTGRNRWWTESLELEGAEVIGRYADTYRQGEPVATRHRSGAGQAIYLGTWFEDEAVIGGVLAWTAAEAGVARLPLRPPRGVEVVRRSTGSRETYWLFNCREEPVSVPTTADLVDACTGAPLSRIPTLPAKGMLIAARA